MAKFDLRVTLKRTNGTQIGNPIQVTDATAFSVAKATVDAEVQARINAEQAELAELQDAQTKLNS